jgi:hypothetical protein
MVVAPEIKWIIVTGVWTGRPEPWQAAHALCILLLTCRGIGGEPVSRNKDAGHEAAIWVLVMVGAGVGFFVVVLLATVLFAH